MLELGRAFGLQAVHFVRGDDAFGLGADVYEDPISVGADHGAFDDFAAPDLRVGGGLFIQEGGHGVLFHAPFPCVFFEMSTR